MGVKFPHGKRLALAKPGDDIVYSPNKYRETEGIKDQQNAIDRSKGIIAKPMPKTWYDRSANRNCDIEDDAKREFSLRIVADKKPYFMRYIYPALSKQYSTYIVNTSKKAMREFNSTIDELLSKPADEQTPEEQDFIKYYYAKMPVGINDCVMNRICRRFEEEFDGYSFKHKRERDFDYSIMKSDSTYTSSQFYAILHLYNDYTSRVQDFTKCAKRDRIDIDESVGCRAAMLEEFLSACHGICSNEEILCDIMLDVCYAKEGTKQFAWDCVANQIIENLLKKNDGRITYPTASDNGDVSYGGEKFSFITKTIGGIENDDCIE